jgi:tRNA/tmRNA/rRNA uracil-C5-methylase (TrmA/RlmC/RlmD family)
MTRFNVAVGQTITVLVEKPAAGGRMIARVDGQVLLVAGAIPGERVVARVDRVGKGVAYASTLTVEEPSADRLEGVADPQCGGCLYAHIGYDRQRALKALVIADAFARVARLPLSEPVTVAPSPMEGYRMRARLHRRGRRFGFFREATHELCDARGTRQLLPATCDIIDRLGGELARLGTDEIDQVEIAENLDASERVVHLHATAGRSLTAPAPGLSMDGLTGLTVAVPYAGCRVLSGNPLVTDGIDVGTGTAVTVRRHVLAFFQGNRFLLGDLVAHVVAQVPVGGRVVDLYAGGGLFAVAVARSRQAVVTAVEGDRWGAEDLRANAAASDGGGGLVTAMHQSVEAFVLAARQEMHGIDVVIVDPPRTGLSREALDGMVRLRPRRVVYVSCDIATLARDARRLVDGGYAVASLSAFDLFPVTPHVECVAVFEK